MKADKTKADKADATILDVFYSRSVPYGILAEVNKSCLPDEPVRSYIDTQATYPRRPKFEEMMEYVFSARTNGQTVTIYTPSLIHFGGPDLPISNLLRILADLEQLHVEIKPTMFPSDVAYITMQDLYEYFGWQKTELARVMKHEQQAVAKAEGAKLTAAKRKRIPMKLVMRLLNEGMGYREITRELASKGIAVSVMTVIRRVAERRDKYGLQAS